VTAAKKRPELPEHLRELGITGGAFYVQGRPWPVCDAQAAKDAVDELRAEITRLADERDVLAARVRELEAAQ
jgi:inosine-uridine nucleoside N-ribohydrolase